MNPILETRGMSALLGHLVTRRSAPDSQGRAPTDDELAWLLRAAAAVPDHGTLRPWRFVVVSDAARHRLGDALAADCTAARPDAPAALIDKARRKAFAAPTLIVLIASPRTGSNVPEWEQLASAACCGYAIVLAAHALGLGAVWKSTPFRDGTALRALCTMAEHEQLLGWVNVGGHDHNTSIELRPPPHLTGVATILRPHSAATDEADGTTASVDR